MSDETNDLKRKILKDINCLTVDLERLRAKLPANIKIEYDWFIVAVTKLREAMVEDMVLERKAAERKKRAYVFGLLQDVKKQLKKEGPFGAWFDLTDEQIKHLRVLCELEGIHAEAKYDDLFIEFSQKEKGNHEK